MRWFEGNLVLFAFGAFALVKSQELGIILGGIEGGLEEGGAERRFHHASADGRTRLWRALILIWPLCWSRGSLSMKAWSRVTAVRRLPVRRISPGR